MPEDENVILETPNETEETVNEPIETEGEPNVDIEQLQATNKKLFERAKKAEADLKALKGTAPQASHSVEETVLLVNGMNEELLEKLKTIAALNKTTLIKAQNDPIFVAVKDKFEKDQKRESASLPASRGAGAVKAVKNFKSPGLTREEHMAMVKSQG